MARGKSGKGRPERRRISKPGGRVNVRTGSDHNPVLWRNAAVAIGDSTQQGQLWDMGEARRRCPRCKVVQLIGNFQRYRNGRTGKLCRMSHCNACQLVAKRASVRKNPDKHWKKGHMARVLKKFGIAADEFRNMLAAQGGVCAICNQSETRRRPNGGQSHLSIDHSHKTGKVRALLCSKCNHMIGLALESPATLRAAADYLERHGEGKERAREAEKES